MTDTDGFHPRIFQFNDAITKSLPILDEDDIGDLTAVLKALAKGRLPRQTSIVKVLNAYNITQVTAKRAWAYFHPITVIPMADADVPRPVIDLDYHILDDLDKPWHSIRQSAEQQYDGESASYRFICFIHKHFIRRGNDRQRPVYTISIWDRELDEMAWHDTYSHERATRQRDIQNFWEIVEMRECTFVERRSEFLDSIRYRMNYRACEKAEATIRGAILPQDTLYSIMSIGLRYMNQGNVNRRVDIVPDNIEFFSSTARELLPRMFVRLLWLYLRAPKAGSEKDWDGRMDGLNDDEDTKEYIQQLQITDKLGWMKVHVRRELEAHMDEPKGEWLKRVEWLFPALRI
ncbi:hypothetical protein F5B22DRAFT_654387 [Xylaria bambusicola]|uniref:uncharacterized protein n=1 Tax=Xylaria bambusicola TaxID=326684 RepID=UPI002007E548|nr:uncharacterized protein F5B22DRAFT_654387 [Xylaria bambusicola]KAI0518069.1 hypothetical protein F5B22DRAFT_654387 [Xylaria bambusicola]